MKKISVLFSLFILLAFAAACGGQQSDDSEKTASDNAEETEKEQNQDKTDENKDKSNDADSSDTVATDIAENQEDMKAMMEQLSFYEIEAEISYGHDQEIDFEIEHHRSGNIEAEVEDELNNVDISDDLDAFNYLYPFIIKLNVSQDMDKETAIKEVLDAFDLKDDYEKFEVEFEFEDGTKLSFEDKK